MLSYSDEQLNEIICLGENRFDSLLIKRAIDSTFSTNTLSIQDLKKMHLVKLVSIFKNYKNNPNYLICVNALTKII